VSDGRGCTNGRTVDQHDDVPLRLIRSSPPILNNPRQLLAPQDPSRPRAAGCAGSRGSVASWEAGATRAVTPLSPACAARGSSGYDISVFEAKLRPQFGTQCWKHEGGTMHQRRTCSCSRFAPEPMLGRSAGSSGVGDQCSANFGRPRLLHRPPSVGEAESHSAVRQMAILDSFVVTRPYRAAIEL
jgi:hypothetical protein